MYLPKDENRPAVYGKILVCKACADKRLVAPDELMKEPALPGLPRLWT